MRSMRKTITVFCLFPMAVFGGAARAGTTTIGQSYGAECFDNASAKGYSVGAITACNRAIEEGTLNRKDHASTLVNRGIVRAHHNDLEGALKDYGKALHMRPELAEAFASRGNVYIRMERYNDALGELNKALKLGLLHPERVYFNRAIVYEILGDTKAAYLSFKKAAEHNPAWDQPQQELQRFTVVSR